MFTKEDMADYLESVLSIEQKALSFTQKLLSGLSDEEVKKEIKKIRDDEAGHVATCKSLIESLIIF